MSKLMMAACLNPERGGGGETWNEKGGRERRGEEALGYIVLHDTLVPSDEEYTRKQPIKQLDPLVC
jgi:hypothetical protein